MFRFQSCQVFIYCDYCKMCLLQHIVLSGFVQTVKYGGSIDYVLVVLWVDVSECKKVILSTFYLHCNVVIMNMPDSAKYKCSHSGFSWAFLDSLLCTCY